MSCSPKSFHETDVLVTISSKLQEAMHKQHEKYGEITIRREKLLGDIESVLFQINDSYSHHEWNFVLITVFKGENGVGPGVTRDLYTSTARAYATRETDGLVAFIDDYSAGLFFGMCILHRFSFNIEFTDYFYQTLSGKYMPSERHVIMNNGIMKVLRCYLDDKTLSLIDGKTIKKLLYTKSTDLSFTVVNDSPYEHEDVLLVVNTLYLMLSDQQKKEFSMFVSGEEVPQSEILLQVVQMTPGSLPVAHTCVYQLDLPIDIFSKDFDFSVNELKRRLLISMQWGQTFGLR